MVWAAFILSIVALVVALMTLPTAAQMIWGKPRLTIKFDSRDIEGGKVMVCELFNYPIINGLKRKIGVRRMPIEDMMADFTIEEYGTNRMVHTGSVPYLLRNNGVKTAQRINLPASIFPAYFCVVAVNYNTKYALLLDGEVRLPINKYIVKVKVRFQENKSNTEAVLIVHNEPTYAYWA